LEFYGILIFLMCVIVFKIVKILEQRDTCVNSWSNSPYILFYCAV
jgi:hypothetical protein